MKLAVIAILVVAWAKFDDAAVPPEVVAESVKDFASCKGKSIEADSEATTNNGLLLTQCQSNPFLTITTRECLGQCISEAKGIISAETKMFNETAYLANLKGLTFPMVEGIPDVKTAVIDLTKACAEGLVFTPNTGTSCPEAKKFEDCVLAKKKELCG